MLVDEYNAFYLDSPNRWASASHDEYVYKTVAPYGPAVNLLDIGCGNGHTLQYFSERWTKSRCVGVDLSDVAIELAQKRLPSGTFICEFWETSALVNFDMVLCVGTAEHFPDPLAGLKRLHDALTDDSIAYLEAPNCIGYPGAKQEEGFRRIQIGSRQTEWHLYRDSWEVLIDKAGLNIRQSKTGPTIYSEFVWILERKDHED